MYDRTVGKQIGAMGSFVVVVYGRSEAIADPEVEVPM
jgi:hypothetical protein